MKPEPRSSRWLRRGAARRWLARARRVRELFPFTLAGLLVIAASLVASLFYGHEHRDHVLLAVGVVGLVLVGASAVLVSLAGLIAWRSARRAGAAQPLIAECGLETVTGFGIRSVRWKSRWNRAPGCTSGKRNCN